MELTEVKATTLRPYRCFVKGPQVKSEGEDVFTVGFKDGLAVVQCISENHLSCDKSQINVGDKRIFDAKSLDLTKLKKIIVKIDPVSGKKYILKDGKRIEIVPQLQPISLKNHEEMALKLKPLSQLTEPPKSKSIIIKRASQNFKVMLNGAPRVLLNDKLKMLLNNNKQVKNSVATMTENYEKSDKFTQTDLFDLAEGGGDSPFLLLNFLLEETEFNNSLPPKKVLDPHNLKTMDDINKFKFFNDMRNALNLDRSGNLPIHESVMQNNARAVNQNCVVLRAIREPVNIPNQQGYAPLHLAILHEVDVDIVRTLLHHGADLNIGDNEGNTALHLAIENNNHEILKVLVDTASERGFNFDVFNHEGLTPLILACLNCSYNDAKLLLQHGADPNVKDMKSGRTALFHAAESHDVSLVELLIEYKADTKIRNFFGTSVHDAMFEVEDMPMKIKYAILGRDHQRFQLKKKSEVQREAIPIKKARLQTTPVLRKVSSSEMLSKPRRTTK